MIAALPGGFPPGRFFWFCRRPDVYKRQELLSDLSDASVLVVRQDTVPAPEINDAIDALRAGKAEFLGCILNDMAHLTAYSAGYGYGYGYYGYGYGKKYDKYGYGHRSGQKQQ